MKRKLTRRDFILLAGGSLVAASGISLLPQYLRKRLTPVDVAEAQGEAPDLYLAGTDGWIYLPSEPALPPYHPDPLAPAPFNTYMFGWVNVTGLTQSQINQQKMQAQHSAPIFWVDQYDAQNPRDFLVQITNLGLAMRPDLFDAHTLHWHGFRNVIPFFDGEPTSSIAVPPGRTFTYAYRPHEPGTYMYHCHVEDIEHVHMGMTGLVFVRPLQNGNTALYPSGRYVYNDGDGSTGYDREFVMFLSEVWAEAHWDDAHIQLPDWTDYKADFSLLNGRCYPDTLAPNGSVDPFNPVRDANGTLIPTPGYEHLQFQPVSSLVRCQAGERVLLRFANLGFMQSTMTLAGIDMTVVGKDATPLRGRDGTDNTYTTSSLLMGAGESFDAIFTAPPFSGQGDYDTYVLYNRDYKYVANTADGGFGGQRTEIRVYPPNSLQPQQYPNDWG